MKKKLIILLVIIIGLAFSLWYVADYYLLNYGIDISLEDLYEYGSENIEDEALKMKISIRLPK